GVLPEPSGIAPIPREYSSTDDKTGRVVEGDLEPFDDGTLEVGNGHALYWEQYGAPQGVPVVYLHGGPGSGCTPGIRSAFDRSLHRAVLFDQRAAGRSTPHASEDLVDWGSIDMDHHLADIEALRAHLGIERWIVFGVSWGSVLGATYAERHADRVLGVVLAAVSLGRAEDIDWLTVDAGRFFPAEWRAFHDHVPEPLRGVRLVDAYNTLLMDRDPPVRDAAASAWCDWESAHVATTHALARRNRRYADPRFRLGFSRQVTHCWRHNSWLAPNEIIANAHRLDGIPGWLIQGRLDLSGPLDCAWLLHEAWPTSNLVIVDDEGHSGVSMFNHWTHALAELASDQPATTKRIARTTSEPNASDPGADNEASPVTFSDGVVVLRRWRGSDASFLHAASQDPAIERFNGPAPESIEAATLVIEHITKRWRSFEADGHPTGVAFAIVDAASGEPVGMCGIDNWSSTAVAQFGYWLAAPARGRGLATRAVTLMTTWLFGLGAARVFLTIQSENIASAAVARRAGFTFEGTLRDYGVWWEQRKDVDVFAVLPDEWPPPSLS
ncbi:MAG: prolyl aminopeptidase, partial [Candidatus Limnocylindrales bacterium]